MTDETCIEDGCDKPVRVAKRGMCKSHYQAWARNNRPKVGHRDCEQDSCTRNQYARGLCQTHYNRLLLTGDPRLRRELDRDVCIEDGCESEARSKGLCKNHYSINWYYNTAGKGLTRTDLSDEVGYQAAHYRLRLQRGRAAGYLCVCGCGEQATDWALKADAVDLRFGPTGGRRETLSAYSLNPDDYQPMTAAHHRAYDAEHHNRAYRRGESRWSA